VIQSFPGEGFDALRRSGDGRALNEGRLIFSLGSYLYDLDASIGVVQQGLSDLSSGSLVRAEDVAFLLSLIRYQHAGLYTLIHERSGYLVTLAQYPGARDYLIRAQRNVEWSEVTETQHIQTALEEYLDASRSRRMPQQPQQHQQHQQQPQQQQQQQQQQPAPAPAPQQAAGRGQPRRGSQSRAGGRGGRQ
jgi:hypothetical protein